MLLIGCESIKLGKSMTSVGILGMTLCVHGGLRADVLAEDLLAGHQRTSRERY